MVGAKAGKQRPEVSEPSTLGRVLEKGPRQGRFSMASNHGRRGGGRGGLRSSRQADRDARGRCRGVWPVVGTHPLKRAAADLGGLTGLGALPESFSWPHSLCFGGPQGPAPGSLLPGQTSLHSQISLSFSHLER